MIRHHGLKTWMLVLLIVIVLPVARDGVAQGDNPGRAFRVKLELAPDFPTVTIPGVPLTGRPDLPAGRYDDSLRLTARRVRDDRGRLQTPAQPGNKLLIS